MQHAEDWAPLPPAMVTMLESEGRARFEAQWRVCADVCRRMDHYVPGTFEPSADWSKDEHTAIQQLLARCRSLDLEQTRQAAQSFAHAFGKWRLMVWDFEAVEANKLRTLCWTLSVLDSLRDLEGAKLEAIDPLVHRIANVLREQWRARLDRVPFKRDPSGWAARGARRFDLLPMSWRWV